MLEDAIGLRGERGKAKKTKPEFNSADEPEGRG
jgi:hypothetical protein